MKAFTSHFSFEFRTGLRDRSLLLMNYLFPLVFYVIISIMMSQLNPGFQDTIIPVMVVFVALTSLVLGLPNPLVSAREAGIFRNYRINGVPTLSVIMVPVISSAVHTLIASILITVTAPLFFHAPVPQNWFGFILFLFLTIFLMAGLGVLIGIISANTRITILWSQLIFLPSMMIGGLMIPTDSLPGSLSKIGAIWPSTYPIDIYNAIANGAGLDAKATGAIIITLAAGLLAFFLAHYLYSWDTQNTDRKGSSWLAAIVVLPLIVGAFVL